MILPMNQQCCVRGEYQSEYTVAQVLVLLTLPSLLFRKAYFEVLDSAGGELQHRFQQKRGMPVAAALEKNATRCNTGV